MKFKNYYFIAVILLMASCVTINKAPKNKPFVLSNKIKIQSDLPKDENNLLTSSLQNYWDDSLKVSILTEFSLKFKKFGYRKNYIVPNGFDESSIARTKVLMNSYLNSLGYYNASFKDTSYFLSPKKYNKKQLYPKEVVININLGKNLMIDSFAIQLQSKKLNILANSTIHESKIKKGIPYSKLLIAEELERLNTLFKKNGYYNIGRDEFRAELDTIDPLLLEITLDPFEQAKKIIEVEKKRNLSPTINIVIQQKENFDSLKLKQFYTGNIYFYPETKINEIPDSLIKSTFLINKNYQSYYLKMNENKFHFKPFLNNTFLKDGTLYNEQLFNKTIYSLSQLNAFQQIDYETTRSPISDSVLDFHFFLTPAKKYSFTADLEATRNTGNIVTAGNLFGISTVLNLINRNVWKESILSNTSARSGVELNFDPQQTLLQTIETSLSHSYTFPKFLTPFKKINNKQYDAAKTIFSMNASYTDRRNFFRLRSLVSSWGYEWRKGNNLWNYKPLNVELYGLDTLQLLIDEFNKKPFLRNAFNTGSVISQSLSFIKTYTSKTNPSASNSFRFFIEEAGALAGLNKSIRENIFRFIKIETEYKKLILFKKNSLAFRVMGGIGINYNDDASSGKTLPFFKQFVAGGPNSMRAWPLRQLGLGSSQISDTASSYKDRFGDVQFETNIEYRFKLATINGFKLESALFTDIGNIWNLRKQTGNIDSELSLSRFYKDIAIAFGTGLRLDFNYFLIRLDVGYKVKDPARDNNGGWMKNFDLKRIDAAGRSRNNYSFQFGIGLPF